MRRRAPRASSSPASTPTPRPRAASGTGTLVDIPADVTSLDTGAAAGDLPGKAFHVRNDGGEAGFMGAAPPQGDHPHRYFFVVHAVGEETPRRRRRRLQRGRVVQPGLQDPGSRRSSTAPTSTEATPVGAHDDGRAHRHQLEVVQGPAPVVDGVAGHEGAAPRRARDRAARPPTEHGGIVRWHQEWTLGADGHHRGRSPNARTSTERGTPAPLDPFPGGSGPACRCDGGRGQGDFRLRGRCRRHGGGRRRGG